MVDVVRLRASTTPTSPSTLSAPGDGFGELGTGAKSAPASPRHRKPQAVAPAETVTTAAAMHRLRLRIGRKLATESYHHYYDVDNYYLRDKRRDVRLPPIEKLFWLTLAR